MKIAILADSIDNQNAGVHFYTKNLIQSLLKIDHKNQYIFIHQKENSFFENTNHHIIPSKKSLGYESFRRFILIPKLIKKLQADIAIEPCHIGPLNMPKNIKKVTIIHDLTPILLPQFHIKRSTIIHKLFLGKILKNADLLITPSQNTKSDIISLYKTKNNIAVIHEGINLPNLNSLPLNSHEKLKKISSPYILFLGTIEPRKNLNTLIDAFLELKATKSIPHKLVLAGGIGWKNQELLAKIAQHNKEIILTNYLSEDEKSSLYKHADIFVYPSLYEGFGLPPLEAMSYGIPVICSTGGSLKEIFENHSLMFDPKDKELLKSHILELINSPNSRQKLISKGLEYSKEFTWENTAKEVISKLEKLFPSKD